MKNNIRSPGGRWRLISEASQVQIWRSHTICLHVCLDIGLLVSGISTLVSKIIYCTWRLLEADPRGQPGTDLEVIWNMPLWYILIVCPDIGLLLPPNLSLACLQDQPPETFRYNILFLTQQLKS